jgi:hypothetical protein
MSFGSAAVRIDVSDRALVEELLEFLRRCACTVERTGPGSLRVHLDPAVSLGAALNLVRAGVCYACTGAIEAPLARLGSALCLECRDCEGDRNGESRADELSRRTWARMEIESYLRVWQVRHPGARVTLSEPGSDGDAIAAAG